MKYCCHEMDKFLADYDKSDSINHSIDYNFKYRSYRVIFIDHEMEGEIFLSEIKYCPYCGTKLPESLADKWFDVLEEEYGITDPHDKEYDKVPAEFRTDEWWKKRGL